MIQLLSKQSLNGDWANDETFPRILFWITVKLIAE